MSFVFMSDNNEGQPLNQISEHYFPSPSPPIREGIDKERENGKEDEEKETRNSIFQKRDKIIPANEIAIERAIYITELQKNQEEYHRKLYQILKIITCIAIILLLLM